MEEYSNIENDIFDICDTSNTPNTSLATTKSQEHKVEYQVQQVHQLNMKVEKKQSRKLGVFKVTSKNGVIQFKAKQELCVTTRMGKSTEAIIKQFASEEL